LTVAHQQAQMCCSVLEQRAGVQILVPMFAVLALVQFPARMEPVVWRESPQSVEALVAPVSHWTKK
jgi:hypothetical protein